MFNGMKDWCTNHVSEILAGAAIVGSGAAVVLAAWEAPKASRILEEEKQKTGGDLEPKEAVKLVWKNAAPILAVYILSAICTVEIVRLGNSRAASLTAACALTESAFSAYKNKVVETIGEAEEKDIRAKIAKEQVDEKTVLNRGDSGVVIVSGDGFPCYDAVSGQLFNSDMNTINRSVNEVNEMLLQDGHVSLNEFYSALGVPTSELYEDVGWNIFVHGLVKIEFDSLIMDDGRPCLTIDFTTRPIHDYENLV